MTQQTNNANDILMGGGGPPAWKFENPITRRGTVVSPPQPKQERDYDPNNPGGGDLKFFASGDPIMGVTVEVQTDDRDNTDDDGRRTFYIEGRYLKEAVRNGIRASGARGLEVGGVLEVQFTHREDPMDKRSRKFWNVSYTPAGNATLMADAAPATAAAPTAPPAPAATPQTAPAAPAPTGGLVTVEINGVTQQVTPEVAALLQQVQPA